LHDTSLDYLPLLNDPGRTQPVKTTTREKLEKVTMHCRMFGFWDTLRYSMINVLTPTRDSGFDLKYGTDTSRVVSMRYDEQPDPGEISRSIPTPPKILRYILSNLGIDPCDFIFLDYGCGKGRALLCASDLPFKRIVGIEWSKDLVQIAKRNIEIYRSPRQRCFEFEVHCMSVLDYSLPVSNTVMYMYNPFGPKITFRVFQAVQQSVVAAPRRFLIVFSGLGNMEDTVVMEGFRRFGIDVLRKCRTLNAQGSWVLGEVRHLSETAIESEVPRPTVPTRAAGQSSNP
jgi:hypothetical protein